MLDMYPFVPPAPYQASGSKSKPKPLHADSFPAAHPSNYIAHPPSLSSHASSSRSIALPLTPISPPSSSSYNPGKRPKLPKKAQSSTAAKQRGVQASLEAQVDKCRGWQAYFLPAKPMPVVPPCSPVLGASRPPQAEVQMESGEDDSDLSRCTSNSSSHPQQQHCVMGLPSGFGTEAMQFQHMAQAVKDQAKAASAKQGQGKQGSDYFGRGWKREEWVEDVDVEAMDLDME